MVVACGTALAACGANTQFDGHQQVRRAGTTSTMAATAADWKPVHRRSGRTGKLGDKDTTYRFRWYARSSGRHPKCADQTGPCAGGYAVFAK